MKTTFTTQHNAASTLNGSHAAHNVYSPLRRLTLLVTLLMTFALGARAQNYYVFYNTQYEFYLTFNGSELGRSNTFNPSTCVWTGPQGNSGTFSIKSGNDTYYLRYSNSNGLTTTMNNNNATAWTIDNNKVYYRSGGNNYYIRYSNSNQAFQARNNNSENEILYKCFLESVEASSGEKSYTVSLTSVAANPAVLDFNKSTTVTANGGSVTITTTTTPAHTKYTLTPNSGSGTVIYWYKAGNNAATQTSPVSQTTSTTTVTGYEWAISPSNYTTLGNATTTTNTNTVTYSTASGTNTTVTLSATAYYTKEGQTYKSTAVNTTLTLNEKKDDPTSITAEDLTLAVDEQKAISYTLEPQTAYDNVDYEIKDESIASVSVDGLVTGKKAGSTQITITAYQIDGVTPACSTTCDVTVMQRCEIPVVTINSTTKEVTITCSTEEVTIYYTTDGTDPSESSSRTIYKGSFSVVNGVTVKAIAVKDGWIDSKIGSASSGGSGETASNPYYVASVEGLNYIAEHPTYHFKVVANFDASNFSETITDFSGTFDGQYYVISGLTRPLFTSANGATIKNVVLDNVNVSGTGNVGGIVATAEGATRIYNCGVRATNGSTIGGGTNTGSIVGELKGNARVVNCYSFADITGGSDVGGIVGYNATASTSSNLATIVMNCMYYGNITEGANKAPIYNGEIITNAGQTGINNYNYYRYTSPYSQNKQIDTYNCALAAEERYLVRHEFYRGILNSQRKLCAFYVKGSINDDNIEEIGKWVLDKSIAPYPIIKRWGKYPSVINNVPTDINIPYQGKVLGSLSVTVSGYGEVSLPITDMDTLNYDYNYYKVQLPYYNDYFDDQYTNNKVVTGWKITSVTGGTQGSFTTTETEDDRYNFADRNCTTKDLYSTTGIVFAQGGYYNVPEGVTAITIEPYVAKKVVYLSDQYYDRVYNTSYTGYNFTAAGEVPKKGRTVYNDIDNAITSLSGGGSTVYDNAIVLVGNYHSHDDTWNNNTNTPFTLMSIDEDKDNEPDYCVFHYHNERKNINPVRFDFLWHPGIGLAKKVTGSGIRMPNQGIFRPKGWFEITETCLARYTEFEYDYSSKSSEAPVILNNGIFEQFVSIWNSSNVNSTQVNYMRLGGNVYFEAFTPGTHSDRTGYTKRPPISITGGEYKAFYLSGVRPDAATTPGNALCYTNGGKFPLFAGAYMEKINGDVIVKMDHSFVNEFYGGGVNSEPQQISGNINITINHSLVNFYCGGPKFGSMAEGKTVTTSAIGTIFGEFYGAGYGGSSFYINRTMQQQNSNTQFNGGSYPTYNVLNKGDKGYVADYHLEFFSYAGGTDDPMHRFYTHYASLTLAQTNNVKSELTDCVINKDFYGGGHLGLVNGNVESTLTNCIVRGNAYGGGYSAAVPKCPVRGLPSEVPTFNINTGLFEFVDFPAPDYYTWANDITNVDKNQKKIPTDVDLTELGVVKGNVEISINGVTRIESKPENGVYGGGNASAVNGTTQVNIKADNNSSQINNVFGGANAANVGGNTTVNIIAGNVGNVFGTNNISGIKSLGVTINVQGGTSNYVYGAGNLAEYTGDPKVLMTDGRVKEAIFGGGLGETAKVTGNPQVTISGGRVGNATKSANVTTVTGDVFGGGSQAALIGNAIVTLSGEANVYNCVYGGGLGETAVVTGDTQVNMTGGTVGYTEKVDGKDVVRGGDVFGGGNAAAVKGNTNVSITAGEVKRNVYGGGNQAKVTGKTNVVIGQ